MQRRRYDRVRERARRNEVLDFLDRNPRIPHTIFIPGIGLREVYGPALHSPPPVSRGFAFTAEDQEDAVIARGWRRAGLSENLEKSGSGS